MVLKLVLIGVCSDMSNHSSDGPRYIGCVWLFSKLIINEELVQYVITVAYGLACSLCE